MVAVHTKTLATLTAFALVVSPLGPGGAGAALETIEPECYPAEDGTGAYICEFPDACEEELDAKCDPPAECELVDERTVRCQPADDGETSQQRLVSDGERGEGEPTLDVLIHPPADAPDEAQLGQPIAECGLDNGTGELVCQPPTECEETDAPDYCQPPDECKAAADGLFRCTPEPGRALPEQAHRNERHDRAGSDDAEEPQPEQRPDCDTASERGVVICTPPPSCLDRLGETPACTPPASCEDLGNGTFRCEIPDRVSETDVDTGGTEEDPFAQVDQEARAEARAEIGQGIREAADSFGSELDAMRADYEQRVDELRAEYEDSKAELRADYEGCRDDIPADATAGERNEALQDCLQQAREGLASLRADMRERHDQVKQTFQQRAEEARNQTCAEAENVALNAVADRGLFAANPADLVPERALELCPAFADFDHGGALG